jgi:hypothetical protein
MVDSRHWPDLKFSNIYRGERFQRKSPRYSGGSCKLENDGMWLDLNQNISSNQLVTNLTCFLSLRHLQTSRIKGDVRTSPQESQREFSRKIRPILPSLTCEHFRAVLL